MMTGRVQEYLWGRLADSGSFRDAPVFDRRQIRTPTQLYVMCTVHCWIDKWL